MFINVENCVLHADPGKVPFLRFDVVVLADGTPDAERLVRLKGQRYFNGQLLAAQVRFRNSGGYWDHWELGPTAKQYVLELLTEQPCWGSYRQLVTTSASLTL